MCLAEKFFFCVPLDLGCLVLGCTTFILSIFMALASTTLLIMEQSSPGRGLVYLDRFPHLVMNTASVNIILGMVILLALLWMICSVMLILGIRKNKSSFVLWYFSFGIMLTILCMLSALLVLLQNHWVLSLVEFIVSMIYIHCLVVVHSTYDLMLSGTVLKFSQRRLSDEAILIVDSTDSC